MTCPFFVLLQSVRSVRVQLPRAAESGGLSLSLDFECVLKWLKMERHQFRTRCAAEVAQAIRDRRPPRDPVWTDSVAVGGRAFVQRVSGGPAEGDFLSRLV